MSINEIPEDTAQRDKDLLEVGLFNRVSLFDGVYNLAVRMMEPLTMKILSTEMPDHPALITSKQIREARKIHDLERDLMEVQKGGHALQITYPFILFVAFAVYLSYYPVQHTQQFWATTTTTYSILDMMLSALPMLIFIHFMARLAALINKPIFIALTSIDLKLSGIGFLFACILALELIIHMFGLCHAMIPLFVGSDLNTISVSYTESTQVECQDLLTQADCLNHFAAAQNQTSSLYALSCTWFDDTQQCLSEGYTKNTVYFRWLHCSADQGFSSTLRYDYDAMTWNSSYFDDFYADSMTDFCTWRADSVIAALLTGILLCIGGLRRIRYQLLGSVAIVAIIAMSGFDLQWFGRSNIYYYANYINGEHDIELDYDPSSMKFKHALMSSCRNDIVVQFTIISLLAFELYKSIWPNRSPKLWTIFVTFAIYWCALPLTAMYTRENAHLGNAVIASYTAYRVFPYLPTFLVAMFANTDLYTAIQPATRPQELVHLARLSHWGQINGVRSAFSGLAPGQSVYGTPATVWYLTANFLNMSSQIAILISTSLVDSITYGLPERFSGLKRLLPHRPHKQEQEDVFEQINFEEVEPAAAEADATEDWAMLEDKSQFEAPGMLNMEYFGRIKPMFDLEHQRNLIENQSKSFRMNGIVHAAFITIFLLVFVLPVIISMMIPRDPADGPYFPVTTVWINILASFRQCTVPLCALLLSVFCNGNLLLNKRQHNDKHSGIVNLGLGISIVQCLFNIAFGLATFRMTTMLPWLIATPDIHSSIARRLQFDYGIIHGTNLTITAITTIIGLIQCRKTPLEKRKSPFSTMIPTMELIGAVERATYGDLLHDQGSKMAFMKDMLLKFFTLPFLYYSSGAVIAQIIEGSRAVAASSVTDGITTSYINGLELYNGRTGMVLIIGIINYSPLWLTVLAMATLVLPTLFANSLLIRELRKMTTAGDDALTSYPLDIAIYENELRINHEMKTQKEKTLSDPLRDRRPIDLASRQQEQFAYSRTKEQVQHANEEEFITVQMAKYKDIFVRREKVLTK